MARGYSLEFAAVQNSVKITLLNMMAWDEGMIGHSGLLDLSSVLRQQSACWCRIW